MLAYCAARAYELDGLMDHTKRNMEIFSKGLSIFQMLEITSDVYSNLPDDDRWFPDHLKVQIKEAFILDKTLFGQEEFLDYIGKTPAFSKALAKIMVDIFTSKQVQDGQCTHEDPAPEELAIDCPQSGPKAEPETLTHIVQEELQEEKCEDPPLLPSPPPPIDELVIQESSDASWDATIPLSKPDATKTKKKDEVALPYEEEVEPEFVPPADEDDAWGSWGTTQLKKKKKDKVALYEEAVELEPVSPNDDDDAWGSRGIMKSKKKKKDKVALYEEAVEPEAVSPNDDDDAWGSRGTMKSKKGKTGKTGKATWSSWSFAADKEEKAKEAPEEKGPVLMTPVESELACPEPPGCYDMVVMPLTEPEIEQSSSCPFQSKHILEGEEWQSCKKCRAVIRRLSIKLLHGGSTVDEQATAFNKL